MTTTTTTANYDTHVFGIVDDCTRCLYCEIGVWNGHKKPCPAAPKGRK